MKLTDFTKEQLTTKEFKRRAFPDNIIYCSNHGVFRNAEDNDVVSISLNTLLADDWEIVREKVKKSITYYIYLYHYDSPTLFVTSSTFYKSCDAYTLLETITKEYEVDEV